MLIEWHYRRTTSHNQPVVDIFMEKGMYIYEKKGENMNNSQNINVLAPSVCYSPIYYFAGKKRLILLIVVDSIFYFFL